MHDDSFDAYHLSLRHKIQTIYDARTGNSIMTGNDWNYISTLLTSSAYNAADNNKSVIVIIVAVGKIKHDIDIYQEGIPHVTI